MSGHSKWHSIKHKKADVDKKRGKIFTKHAKLIAVAARKGGDPNMNPTLRAAIDNARAENMPVDNIDRAIKKGTGESKESAQIEEVVYEGYGPGGVALYIETLTDNRHRTIANLKNIVTKKGGNLGAAGSVGYLFQRKGLVNVDAGQKSSDEIELLAIDAGAQDIKVTDGLIEIYTAPQSLMQVKKALEAAGIKVDSARLTYMAQNAVPVAETAIARKLIDLIEAIEEDEDVTEVYSNDEINPEILETL
jgi:YebC/PmpR family DNA-binding regulatory protein